MIRTILVWIVYPFDVAWIIIKVFVGAFLDWMSGWRFFDSVQIRVNDLDAENEAKLAELRKRKRELVRECRDNSREFDEMAAMTRAAMEFDLQVAIQEGNEAEEENIRRQLNMLKDMEQRQRFQIARMNKEKNP